MIKLLRSIPLTLVLLLAPLTRVVRAQHFSSSEITIKNKLLKRVNSNVVIQLRNGSELRGRITSTSENMFRLKEDRSSYSRDIYFSDVLKIKNGGSLSKGAKFGILTGILTGTVLIGLLIGMKNPQPAR
jgi:small nuclear ribonucleoprotein (snRNP)-like protein